MDDPSRPLGEGPDFTEATDPFALFRAWMAEAEAAEPVDPEAMALATVDAEGLPNVRMVLLKGADERGLVFYSNCDSAKGRELAANAQAALLFYWKSVGRQNSTARARRAGHRRRGQCLFRHAAPREPDRRLRLASVAPAHQPRGARSGSCAADRGDRHWRGAASGLLARLPAHSA